MPSLYAIGVPDSRAHAVDSSERLGHGSHGTVVLHTDRHRQTDRHIRPSHYMSASRHRLTAARFWGMGVTGRWCIAAYCMAVLLR